MNKQEDMILKTIVRCCNLYADHNTITYDKEIATNFVSHLIRERAKKIFIAVGDAGRQADIFSSLERDVIDPLVREAGRVTFMYECTKFAKEIVDFSAKHMNDDVYAALGEVEQVEMMKQFSSQYKHEQ